MAASVVAGRSNVSTLENECRREWRGDISQDPYFKNGHDYFMPFPEM